MKLPNISSKDLAHPDPSASFTVSINCVKVFTFVAAFVAVSAISWISLISSLVYPIAFNSDSDISPANSLRVSERTLVLSHEVPFFDPIEFLNVSFPDLIISYCSLVMECIALAVLNNASWKTLPPIPAFTTEFQS